jgi:hypothetical protein
MRKMFKVKCLPTAADETINNEEMFKVKCLSTAADDTINKMCKVQSRT